MYTVLFWEHGIIAGRFHMRLKNLAVAAEHCTKSTARCSRGRELSERALLGASTLTVMPFVLPKSREDEACGRYRPRQPHRIRKPVFSDHIVGIRYGEGRCHGAHVFMNKNGNLGEI